MTNLINFETRRALEVPAPLENRREEYPGSYDLFFTAPPHIENRSDALALLDDIIGAEFVEYPEIALRALRDALEREII